jgi:tetratricopeptide (TPR) repeat protein/predicted Ser/Thr protein kinase
MAEARDFPAGDTGAGRAPFATVSEAEPSGPAITSLPRGTAVHRYVLLDEIGAGGMGVVYAAYDYGLDRKVAIKLVRDPGRSAARRRLVREAQALAQLSHPNVVTVFDVGTYRDQVFVAMEFVAGQTLRTWLGGARRGWREVVDVLRRAGEGLAAAHGAGIVHRDFKPDNVLIDGQGRVRVGDFGLAFIDRGEEDEDEDDGDHAEPGATASLDDPTTSLTVTGMAVGTPAYMAPEQRTPGLPLDGRADQFAFCVALHEALCGERPFGDESGPDLIERVARGAVRELPRDRAMPAGLRRIIRRGLAFDAADRYPSMEALLADVDRVLGARGRRTIAAAAGGAALIVATSVLASSGLLAPDPVRPCRGAAGKLAGVWDAGRKQAVRAAFVAASPRGGERAFAHIEPALDRYGRSWTAMHTESCEATHVRGEQSAALLDLRTQCLDRRLAGLRALTDLFLTADAKLVTRATQAVLALDPVDVCANTTALRDVVPPRDAATRARADQLRERVARVRALVTTGKYRDAVAQAGPLVAEARALAYRPLEADALAIQGRALRATDKLAEAEDTLYQAITAAESGRNGEASVEAWLELLWVVGDEQKRIPEARRLAQVARGAIERLGGGRRIEARLEDWSGMMYFYEARYEEAREPLQRSIALLRQHGGEENPDLGTVLRHLGDTSVQLGRSEEALGIYRRARAITEKHYGPEHPNAISLVGSEGATLHYLGRQDEALAIFERGLAAEERGMGAQTHTAGTFHKFIGLARLQKGDLEGARKSLERSVEVLSAVFGADHSYVGPALSSLGMVLTSMKRWREAMDCLQRSVAIQERHMGVDHPDVALALDRIGQLHIESGQPKRAVAPLERGLRIRERHAGAPRDLAVTRYQLAQALRRSRGPRARVKKLLRAALTGFEKAGDKETAAQTRKWLRARGLVEPK